MISSLFGYFTASAIPEAPPLPDIFKKPSTLELELKAVKLRPALGRNKPKMDDDYDMIRLTELYIRDILSVKLKHVEVPPRAKEWRPRHPVLQEFMSKAVLIN